ncbi:ATP-binding protein [Sinomonas sp. ASV322]|uniref:AAA family ATPase n=1 Tax=Sinomonas sp. ASV322 TaxID=3041920 RepID=UPI0027DB173C|nr:ATP-binding protein [Sinomonas sp. ASV322]MDQ4502441.1 ATP-binding protein [Sinomonas sp. ASV322]
MDEALGKFIDDFGALVRIAAQSGVASSGRALRDVLAEHLGSDPDALTIVVESVPPHRLVDIDSILESLAAEDPEAQLVGVSGGEARNHATLRDMVQSTPWMGRFALSQPDFANLPVGPDQQRRTVSFGVRLFRFAGRPVTVLQREPSARFGRPNVTLEVITPDDDVASGLLAELHRRLDRESVFKGQVISLAAEGYGPGRSEAAGGGATFIERPRVPDDEVILPDGLLGRIHAHTLGVGRNARALTARGQHLKRGLLLYGPPGTGKTHTVRHLLGSARGTTVVMLTGRALARVAEAASLARALAPSIVVLEDVDLVAEDRSFSPGPQPLLFEILDALDGLEGDADVAFVLTTNRVELLERALAQRPGRVDLAVELPLPALAERRALLRLYGRGMDFSEDALDRAALQTEGTTAALAKELVRRAVLGAAEGGAEPGDSHLDDAAAALMAEAESLTRSLLGGRPTGAQPPVGQPAGPQPPFGRPFPQPPVGQPFPPPPGR